MGIVYMKDKPESESYNYVYVEDSEGKLRKISLANMKKFMEYVTDPELNEILKKYLSEDDNEEIVSHIENTDTGIRVYTRDGEFKDVSISQAKEFETVEFDNDTRYLHFYDSEGTDVYDPVHIEGGGSGGGGNSSVITLTNQNGTNTLTVADGATVILSFNFTSLEDEMLTGDGSCQIMVNGVSKKILSIPQGITNIDISKYLSSGTNTVKITCTDVYGNYKSLIYKVTLIEMYLTSTFDATVAYNGDITFKYIAYGALEKTIHILVDATEISTTTTTASGKQSTYIVSAMTHGIHRLEVYATAELNGVEMESEHLIYDIMCIEKGNNLAMISSIYDETEVTEGTLVSIPYIAYDPSALSTEITLDIYTIVNEQEEIYSTQSITVDRSQQYWNTRKYPTGTVYFRIKYGDISKIHTIEVSESNIKIEPETNDLELSLMAEGRTNNEEEPEAWNYGKVTTVFDGFNWNSNGWINDENGDTCLRFTGDATAEIQFKPFDNDIRTHGKTLELEFAIRDVNSRGVTVISCLSGGIGFEIKADTAYLKSEQSNVFCKYKDNEKVKLAFVVEARSEYRTLSVYLNGNLTKAVQYPDSDNFQQSSPVNITIGNSKCGVDIYGIRSYSTALTASNSVNNYIADIKDIVEKTEAYERNDIYDEYGNLSFEEVKKRNSVMVIVGDLPQSKGDKKNVTIKFYDVDDSSLNYTDKNVILDVQGTSSQYYARKNWKAKSDEKHYIDKSHLPVKILCIKVDYAEGTGTHNTQNAVLIETLYSEKIPPQEKEPLTRTTIYGKPIVLFHQADENSEPVFYAKANMNYDKGAEETFGFTEDYDVECWEFCNNTSDVCNFLAKIPDEWGDDFEARYPEDYTDISRFKTMHDWAVSTRRDTATGTVLDSVFTDTDGNEYTTDTAEYRLAKFKMEFENYFNMHYSLIYYVYTFFALMIDQRAKNMFLTYWASKGKWYPYFYDNDTCFGINNEGQLVFDYYHEDTDKMDGANVYNGQNSVLWCNFRDAFPDKIKETYQNLRNNGYITYEKMVNRFITNGSDKWAESIYNEDSDAKYITMLRSSNDATNLSQITGSGEEYFRYFAKNRINYCDSKWYASDYADDYISLRIYTPEKWTGVEPNAAITVTPFSNMYAGVRYKANGTLLQKRVESGEPVTFGSDITETFNDTETAIYGAHQLSSIGDLAPLYCGSINVSNAEILIELKVGDGTDGYSNENLKELHVGVKKLLRRMDVQNCPNLTSVLDLSNCPSIEEVYAKGSGITGVSFPEGGLLKKAQLPETITNFTLKHQIYVEELTFEGYDEIKTLWVEGCPTIDGFDILSKAKNVERLRLCGVNVTYETADELIEFASRNIKGIDENGTNVEKMWIDGTCHISSITGAEYATIKETFPYLTITYDHITSYCYFYDEKGEKLLYSAACTDGSDASYAGDTPTKASTAQYTYAHSGWSLTPGGSANSSALKKVVSDRNVYAAFQATIRTYTVYFYVRDTLWKTVTNAPYGSNATPSEVPESPDGSADEYPFVGWDPSPIYVTGNMSCYAKFGSLFEEAEIEDSWEEIFAAIDDGTYKVKYSVGNYKPLDLGTEGIVNMQIAAKDTDELSDGGLAPVTWISKELLVTNRRMNLYLTTNYGYKEGDGWGNYAYATSITNDFCVSGSDKYLKASEEAVWRLEFTAQSNFNVQVPSQSISSTGSGFKNDYAYKATVNDDTIYENNGGTENVAVGTIKSIASGEQVTIELRFKQDSKATTSEYKNINTAYLKFADTNGDQISLASVVCGSNDSSWTSKATITISSNQIRYTESYQEGTGTIGGWEDSEMRTYLKETIKPLIPEVVRNRIKEVKKYSDIYRADGSKNKNTISYDDVWIPSFREVFKNRTNYETVGAVYATLFTDDTSRIKHKTGETSGSPWWLRSAYSVNGFANVYSTGASNYNSVLYTRAVALSFCT